MRRSSAISIIVPNYNRADALPATCLALSRQTFDSGCLELIIVDDGSTDDSLAIARQFQEVAPFPVEILQQAHRGPGAARNRGVRAANHEVLLFLDSDTIADTALVEIHAELHAASERTLVAGARRPWPPACTSTFSRVMHLEGLHSDQFGERSPTFQDVFSCNMSIRRSNFAELGGFDESLWAFEDVDLAYRAQQSGLELAFAANAVGYHNHPMTLQQAYQQQRNYQRYAGRFVRKHPEVASEIHYLTDKWPIDWRHDSPRLILRKLARQVVSSRPLLGLQKSLVANLEHMFPRRSMLRFLYWKIIAGYQFQGLREGLQSPPDEPAFDTAKACDGNRVSLYD